MTETKTAKRPPLFTLTGKVIEAGPAKDCSNGPYTVSKVLDKNGKTKTVMCFGKLADSVGKGLEVGQDVSLKGSYREGSEGGYTFVAAYATKAKGEVAAAA